MNDDQVNAIVDASYRIATASDKIVDAATKLLEAMVAAEGRTVQKLAAEMRKVNEARALLSDYREEREADLPPAGGRRIRAQGQEIQLPPDTRGDR